MKLETLQKRWAKIRLNYRGIARDFGEQLTGAKPQKWPIFRGGVIRPIWTSGRGRFCSNCDHTRDICAVLDALCVKYETGNDAPRGGLTGNFIKIVTKIVEYERF